MKRYLKKLTSSQWIKAFVSYYKSSELSLSSIAVAYYMLLTMFPFLMLLANIFPYLNIDTSDLMSFLKDSLPKQLYDSTANIVRSIFSQPSSSLLWLSIATGFWTMSRTLTYLQQAFNKAYDVQENRSFILSYAIGLLTSFIVVVFLAIAIVISTFGKSILTLAYYRWQLDKGIYDVLMYLTQPITAIIFFLTLACLYYILPNVKIRKFQFILPGTLFSSLVLVFTTHIFGNYVTYTMNKMDNLRNFSSVTTFMMMLWFIFFSRILITGAIFNATYHKKRLGKFELRRDSVRTFFE